MTDRKLPPVTPLAMVSLALIVIGGIYPQRTFPQSRSRPRSLCSPLRCCSW